MIDIKTTPIVTDNSECDKCHTRTPEKELTTLYYQRDYDYWLEYEYKYVAAVDLCPICLTCLVGGRREKK
jgi:hypothetical protein